MGLFQRNRRQRQNKPLNPAPPNRPRQSSEPIDPDLPQLHTNKWIVGWKVSNLLVSTDGKHLALEQVMQDGHIRAYSLDDTAMCNQWGHTAPDKDCACGFNAYTEPKPALDYGKWAEKQAKWHLITRNLVLLRVGLYGRMIEGTLPRAGGWGYRSTKQRVDTICLPVKCGFCGKKATMAAAEPKEGFPHFGVYLYLRPSCDACATPEVPHFTLPALAKVSGVKVRWI